MSGDRVAALLAGLATGERSAVSEAMNLVDDQRETERDAALALLDALATSGRGEGAMRVGLTGAPGAGKSSLLNALVSTLRKQDRSVGIIAVDPSSQRTGGALLGDRMRLGSSAREQGVFLRSMAARDRLGGLADATHAGVTILASVFDVVFVETVGVGQSECDVAQLVDTLVFVVQPGAGDMLQFMKAGILELPDIFVVNKCDVGAAAERSRAELAAGLDLGSADTDAWEPPVLLASATERIGIEALAESIDRHRAHLEAGDGLARRRSRARHGFVLEMIERRYGQYGLDAIGGREGLTERVDQRASTSAFRLVLELGREIEASLRAPAH